MKETRILVAGFGGQGIIFLGRLLAYAGMLEGREVTCFPSYGAEMRGGTANCTTIISDEMIGSPVVKNTDILLAMNEASFKKFQPRLRPGGLLIYDSSLIRSPDIRPDLRAIAIPASRMSASYDAEEAQKVSGSHPVQVKPANMLMLGALLAETGVLKTENAADALNRLTSEKRRNTLEANKEAIRKGMSYIADQKSKDN